MSQDGLGKKDVIGSKVVVIQFKKDNKRGSSLQECKHQREQGN